MLVEIYNTLNSHEHHLEKKLTLQRNVPGRKISIIWEVKNILDSQHIVKAHLDNKKYKKRL